MGEAAGTSAQASLLCGIPGIYGDDGVGRVLAIKKQAISMRRIQPSTSSKIPIIHPSHPLEVSFVVLTGEGRINFVNAFRRHPLATGKAAGRLTAIS